MCVNTPLGTGWSGIPLPGTITVLADSFRFLWPAEDKQASPDGASWAADIILHGAQNQAHGESALSLVLAGVWPFSFAAA